MCVGELRPGRKQKSPAHTRTHKVSQVQSLVLKAHLCLIGCVCDGRRRKKGSRKSHLFTTGLFLAHVCLSDSERPDEAWHCTVRAYQQQQQPATTFRPGCRQIELGPFSLEISSTSYRDDYISSHCPQYKKRLFFIERTYKPPMTMCPEKHI